MYIYIIRTIKQSTGDNDMNTLTKILCKTVDAICATADFIGTAVAAVIKWSILSALALSAMVAALLLWLSVPYFTSMTLFSEINSQWQVFAVLGIFGAWAILSKIAYDWWDRRRDSRIGKALKEHRTDTKPIKCA